MTACEWCVAEGNAVDEATIAGDDVAEGDIIGVGEEAVVGGAIAVGEGEAVTSTIWGDSVAVGRGSIVAVGVAITVAVTAGKGVDCTRVVLAGI